MLSSCLRLLFIASVAWGLTTPAACLSDEPGFLKTHCYDCHSGPTSEGGLDLTALDGSLDSQKLVERWTTVFDRVAHGEMPPEEADQPEPQETDAFLTQLETRLLAADRSQRETVHRRLNRSEYEDTVHDLLQIDIPLSHLLPEDQIADGFSNNGAALAVSTEQLEAYLETAELAVDAVIVRTAQPPTETFVVDALAEVKPYLGQQYELVDGRIVIYLSDRSTYSKISTRSKKINVRGRYRVSFDVAVHNPTGPQTFFVDADGVMRYYEATAQPQTYTFEQTISAGGVIQFHAVDLPGWVNDPIAKKVPGVGFGPVTLTGPLHDTWPPASHQQLFGDIDFEKATIQDAADVLSRFLPRAFRRPVTDAELNRYVMLVQNRLDAGRSFEDAIRVALTTVLCSPSFLYLKETQRPATEAIDAFELASRLSFFLWNSMPDERLLQLAAEGRLAEKQTLTAEVDRMLDDARSERFIENFTDHWLHLRRIHETTPDRNLFPDFDDHLKHSMVAESRSYFRHVLEHDKSIDLFLDSDFSMLNRRLARHYGIPDVEGATVHPVSLPQDSVRGGVLTQAAVLKVTANGTNTSPVLRGVWALENILGRRLPPPPPNVSAIEPDIRGAETVRQQLVKHRSIASCNICHKHIDPPGFALEAFDPVGTLRAKYVRFQVNPDYIEQGWGRLVEGADVDASGTLATGESFQDIREFKQLMLQQRDQFARYLTEKLFTFALGREMGFSDRAEIQQVAATTAEQSIGLKSLVHRIIQSRTFQEN